VIRALWSCSRRPEAPDAIEGAYLQVHDGRYYLFVSFDFCCRGLQSTYNIRVGRSDVFEGPYDDRDGQSMLEGGGTMVDHTYDAQYGGISRMRILALAWDDGWPQAPNYSNATTCPVRCDSKAASIKSMILRTSSFLTNGASRPWVTATKLR